MLALDGVGFIKNSPNFTPWAFDVSYAFSCAMSSQIKISWNDAELTDQWLSFWRGNAGRWIRHVTSQGASIAKTALHRTNARGAARRTTGGGQKRKILRRWGRPGEASSSWRGPADVEGARCCLICLLDVKDMSELTSLKGNLYRCSRGIRKAVSWYE